MLASAGIFLILLYIVSAWYILYGYGYVLSCLITWKAVEKVNAKNINSSLLLIFIAIFLSIFQWWFAAKFVHLPLFEFSKAIDIQYILHQLDPFYIFPHDIDTMKVQVPLFSIIIFVLLKTR